MSIEDKAANKAFVWHHSDECFKLIEATNQYKSDKPISDINTISFIELKLLAREAYYMGYLEAKKEDTNE